MSMNILSYKSYANALTIYMHLLKYIVKMACKKAMKRRVD